MSENKPLIEFTTDNKVIINGIEITNKNDWNIVLNHLEEYYKKFNKISALLNYEQDKRIELENIIKEAREYLTDEGVCILNKGKKENERLVWTWENYYDLLEILKGSDKE